MNITNPEEENILSQWSQAYSDVWDLRDRRVDDWILMSSPWPTLLICCTYLYLVKVWGPNYMKDRPAMNLRAFLIWYNAFQVILSTYIFVQLLRAGWWNDYSFKCQPVDYTDNPKSRLMLHSCWVYFISKFTEFFDTFCFVARKKFDQVSLLHVVHHGLMPLSCWPGARFLPGGHSTFFALLNSFVHIVMYAYYLLAGLGPRYQKYLWWKQHVTTLQMIQFVAVMLHGFQLAFYDDCGFPWKFSYYIAAHAVLFFVLFSKFYIKAYIRPKKLKATQAESYNTHRTKVDTCTVNGEGQFSPYNKKNGNTKKLT